MILRNKKINQIACLPHLLFWLLQLYCMYVNMPFFVPHVPYYGYFLGGGDWTELNSFVFLIKKCEVQTTWNK